MQSPKNIRRATVLAIIGLGATVLASCTPEQIAMVQRIHGERQTIQSNSFLTCVRRHESDRGPAPHINGYSAKNPVSTASGAYQFLNGTWRVAASRAGYGSYANAPARNAPAWVQDAVAYDTAIRRGERYHWNGTGC